MFHRGTSASQISPRGLARLWTREGYGATSDSLTAALCGMIGGICRTQLRAMPLRSIPTVIPNPSAISSRFLSTVYLSSFFSLPFTFPFR